MCQGRGSSGSDWRFDLFDVAADLHGPPLRTLWQPNNRQWWLLVIVAVLIVLAWPPRDGKSLAVTFVNWAVDPGNALPVLPRQLSRGEGDDPDAVYQHDLQVQQYDALYLKGGWTRKRLELKVARDPFDPATTRQVLTMVGVITALVVWRLRRSES
jgi:hypothetical protein